MTKDCDMTDPWMNDSFSIHHDLTLSSATIRSLLLHLTSRSFWSGSPACSHSLFWSLFHGVLAFFLATLAWPDLYPKLSCFLVFLIFVSMIYGECGLRMKRLHANGFFLFCSSTEYMHEGVLFYGSGAYGWQQHRLRKYNSWARALLLLTCYSRIFLPLRT